MYATVDVGRPLSGDVIDLIQEDHRRMEALLRALRDSSSDRAALRGALAELLVAHAEAEERLVYPKLRRRSTITAHDAEHGREEHAEGHAALLTLLELKGTDTEAFDDALEDLSNAIAHHLAEEELSILNSARDDLGDRARAALGAEFAGERNRLIDEGCAGLDQVRALVHRAEDEGLIDEDV